MLNLVNTCIYLYSICFFFISRDTTWYTIEPSYHNTAECTIQVHFHSWIFRQFLNYPPPLLCPHSNLWAPEGLKLTDPKVYICTSLNLVYKNDDSFLFRIALKKGIYNCNILNENWYFHYFFLSVL